ncbi:thiamine-phosphate pyrophosphorylase [Cyclobacterium xiamenense]|uniref:Thiamine-phosphate pyrophosphorylase n=1 Tax=Cyclobacterium xiamenense TaxID=1297121 RepID=A0A1H6THS6_9BACT|nr:thiamine phosphate synthase [Cyclobacterium xiamenense]SEI79633.1 thiamine-phosphate pyrophosphorylase [Cyclobacterium xiamenense]
MKIILLSDFYPVPEEHLLLHNLFEQGLRYFHLRKKNYTTDEMVAYLNKIPSQFLDRIIIHSHFHLVEEFGLKGVHFNKAYTVRHFMQDNSHTVERMREKYRHISHSVHSLSDIQNNDFPFDYLFLSPVFDSISNKGYNSQIKILTIKKFFKSEPDHVDVIALTGITAEKVNSIYHAGFNGMGLLGHIWVAYKENGNLENALEKFKKVKANIVQIQAVAPKVFG